jgi:general secretion pathway protein J
MIARHRTLRGFTLLEILIAMAVFAIMAGMAYAGLRGVLATREATGKRAESLAQLQQLLYSLNEDLAQAVPRSVRDELGTDQPAFSGGNGETLLMFTRSIPDWSPIAVHSQLQRVAYRLEGKSVYRQVWTVLDRTQQSGFRRRKMLEAEGVGVNFFDQEWKSSWAGGEVPAVVEVNLDLPGVGVIKRLFMVQQ